MGRKPKIPEDVVKDIYCSGQWGTVAQMSKRYNISSYTIYTKAHRLGLTKEKKQWIDKEVSILKKYKDRSDRYIQEMLGKVGSKRSIISIKNKRARLALFKENGEGYTATELAEGFGVDPTVVSKWIKNGWIRAIKIMGDEYCIYDDDIAKFIKNYYQKIDLRKVSKEWFMSFLVDYAGH